MRLISVKNHEKPIRHQGFVKETNIKQIFDLILEHGRISRVEISKKNKLSRAAVSMLVDELTKAGLVTIAGEGSSVSSGRKPIMLEINKDRAQIITLSLKKQSFTYVLFDLKGNEIETFSKKIVYKTGYAKKIRESILEKSPRLDVNKLLALCVTIPAKLNVSEKTINLSVLDIQGGCDLLAELKAVWPDIPLVAGNLSSAYAYAEYKYAYGGKINNMIFFYIDDGVGAGVLMNGRVFTSEIGHMSIDAEGPVCDCGKRGCVERMVGKTALLREFEQAGGIGPNAGYDTIRKALEKGDKQIVRISEQISGKIALCISNVICMFTPEELVVGGGIELLGKVFLDMIARRIELPGEKGVCSDKRPHISYSRIREHAEAKGAFRYFLDNILTITAETENKIYCWN
ncbi:MAG: ROK family transcriptional regulator [Treponema sp.]|nr:ROK family transcriptional regulator [Treponema sp.]